MIAASRLETVLVSESTGDVLVCRGREDAAIFLGEEESSGGSGDAGGHRHSLTPSVRAAPKVLDKYFSRAGEGGRPIDQPQSSSGVRRRRSPASERDRSPQDGNAKTGRGGLLGGAADPNADPNADPDVDPDVDPDADPNANPYDEVGGAQSEEMRASTSASTSGSICSLDPDSDMNLLPSFDYSHLADEIGLVDIGGPPPDKPAEEPAITQQPQPPSEDLISWTSNVVSEHVSGFFPSPQPPEEPVSLSLPPPPEEPSYRQATGMARARSPLEAKDDDEGEDDNPYSLDLDLTCQPIVLCWAQPPEAGGDGEARTTGIGPFRSGPSREPPPPPSLLHGIPSFFSALSQIFVSKVSAHPLGSHVLLVSREALLFSYGGNQHGQLGHGRKEGAAGSDPGSSFVGCPAVVTPILENGGKALDCAAGVDHSLVVVRTSVDRVGHLLRRNRDGPKKVGESSDVVGGADESFSTPIASSSEGNWDVHHQVYGFGRNDYMKLGLNNPSPSKRKGGRKQGKGTPSAGRLEEDDVPRPRTVRLGVTFPQHRAEDGRGLGIFSIAASAHHSAALVRTDNGSVELYTWGRADRGALGHGDSNANMTKLPRSSPIPRVVESMSYQEDMKNGSEAAFPNSVHLGPDCTSIVMSDGRCLTFGSSKDGLLGLGPDTTTALSPAEIKFDTKIPPKVKRISYGGRHAVAIAEDGSAFAWGISDDGRLGTTPKHDTGSSYKPEAKGRVVWDPSPIHIQRDGSTDDESVANACAGLDNTILLTTSGKVFSCGTCSGRLGQGEVSHNIHTQTPMFGGLQMHD